MKYRLWRHACAILTYILFWILLFFLRLIPSPISTFPNRRSPLGAHPPETEKLKTPRSKSQIQTDFQKKKTTALRIPMLSPTIVLTEPLPA